MDKPRNKRGQFKKVRGWYLNEKGYPRYSSGPYKGRYVHRVKMELHLGRKLTKDEDVHHIDGDKTNFKLRNLEVMGHREHGCVSALQHWYVKTYIEPKQKREWDKYFQEGEQACP
jgi:hypothetical protein